MTRRRALTLAAVILALFPAAPGNADPVAPYLGVFRGETRVRMADDGSEQELRCRMAGERGETDGALDLALKCATLRKSRSLRLELVYSADGKVTSFTITDPPQALRARTSLVQGDSGFTIVTEKDGRISFDPTAQGIMLSIDAPDRMSGEVQLRRE